MADDGGTGAVEAFATAVQGLVVGPRRRAVRGAGVDPLPLSEVEVLLHLVDHPGSSPVQVARHLGLQVSNVSVTVRRLERRGLVRRSTDPSDGRRVVLSVTPRALEEKARIDRVWVEDISRFLDSLPEAERRAALAAATPLQRLAALGSAPGEPGTTDTHPAHEGGRRAG
ncbi:MarR family winged helix-turn-helix transcriptional regulator [Actinomyces polynesiensis]|uniref:MarR family winged helix-turn-helix transcriptional regulator n=1 Tax=Actinomyces polynesiensis TaxID=1325934 RepID=UPI000693A83E|nr:MarR family transcriptional regulator [Actinomyces polynesiensis]